MATENLKAILVGWLRCIQPNAAERKGASMKHLKHRESGVIVKAPDQTAKLLTRGGTLAAYTYTTRGAFRRQRDKIFSGKLTLKTINPNRSLVDRLRRKNR